MPKLSLRSPPRFAYMGRWRLCLLFSEKNSRFCRPVVSISAAALLKSLAPRVYDIALWKLDTEAAAAFGEVSTLPERSVDMSDCCVLLKLNLESQCFIELGKLPNGAY